MSLVSLREHMNDKIERLEAINNIVQELCQIETVANRSMGKNIALERMERLSGEDDDYDESTIDGSAWAGCTVIFNSIEFFASINPDTVYASNNMHYFEEIQKLSNISEQKDFNKIEPSFAGLSDHEIGILEQAYWRKINALNTRLRNIDTTMKYIMNSRIWSTQRATLLEPEFRGYRTIMEKEYLDTKLPVGVSSVVLEKLSYIRELSTPKPGEPPSLDGFSSHTTNSIQLKLPHLPQSGGLEEVIALSL